MGSDPELLAAWISGDRSAGHALFTRHFEAVRRFFANKVNDPEDLIQATFLACTDAKAKFRGESSFKTYLLGIARKVLLKHLRSLPKQPLIDVEDVSLADWGKRPSSCIAHSQLVDRLLRALRMLSLRHQIILELHYWEEMRVHELGQTLELSHKAAESLLHRAKRELGLAMRKLERSEGAPESLNHDLEAWARSIRTLMFEPKGA